MADADSLDPDTPVELNGDGTINDEDALTRPGDPYDISRFPAFQRDAFRKPFVDPELAHDQWGTFLSGTAPIEGKGASMPARYVIGFDLDVSEFETLTNLALVPFAMFVVFLLIALTTLTIILKRMWQSQVMLLDDIDRQKDELLGMIAHQLSTPITAVAWSTEGLLAGDSGPSRRLSRPMSGPSGPSPSNWRTW
ncbi:MAG TPA: hypothetical protein VHR66_26060 [Gemmataceae bacterium]|nr:hypothetical protein [Gemmataceae bacterium]